MRFVINGPDIPTELIEVQEAGNVIFVCGAGVSVGAGLPLFRGLVESVYRTLGEDFTLHPAEHEGMRPRGALYGQYDRVLRCLERRLAASEAPRNRGMRERIRSAVHQALAPPNGADLSNHLTLLGLSRDAEGRTRLLTTNFDTLFERAWFDKHSSALPTHAGIAMPQPKVSACTGVLHLHGRLADPRPELHANESDLVLTSAEFGDAYLRLGWASRYIYDVVRAYSVVLVGYQADDPPVRYLLETLETDRERYPDLQRVYAFAAYEAGAEVQVKALWEAKAVEPILYAAPGHDHALLYRSLHEWRDYAEDPTAWRRRRLQPLLSQLPSALGEHDVDACADLLRHGDAGQLLGEISPNPEWLKVLVEKRVFDWNSSLPGEWIAKRVDDAGMIKACGGLGYFDDQCRWHIERALEKQQETLSAVRMKAWRLLITAKRQRTNNPEDSWYLRARHIARGRADHEARVLVRRLLQPRLEVKTSYRWLAEETDPQTPETVRSLLWLDFEPPERPPCDEILAAWPKATDKEVELLRVLDRALVDALEEAEDAGILEAWDSASHDVPSVAPHPQNAHHTGFYPITRVMADLWLRIAASDAARARHLMLPWLDSPYLLGQRIGLFALLHQTFSAAEVANAVAKMDDKLFWNSSAQVELIRLLVGRWAEFTDAERTSIETRLRTGVPRDFFRPDAFKKDEDWVSIRDSSIYRRLKRLELAEQSLSEASATILREIAARHPTWTPSSGDRDDFGYWTESRSGPDGEPALLAEIADDKLVQEGMRLQRERHFDQGDIWRVFCGADPDRALRGLRAEADAGRWESEAWRSLLWAANDKGDADFQFTIGGLMLRMPEARLVEVFSAATSWLQKRREVLAVTDGPHPPIFFQLWDRFADSAYGAAERDDGQDKGRDLLTEVLNHPGGVLAWTLVDALSARRPERDAGLGDDLKSRFTRAVTAPGRPGLLARVYVIRALAYFDAIDPAWTAEQLTPRLSWDHPEAIMLWHSYAHGSVGSARLFNSLKPAMIAAFEKTELTDHDFEGLGSKLLSVAIWHQRGEAAEHDLSTAEVRRALTIGPPSARKNVSWNLWRMMASAEEEPTDKAARWRNILGPLFRDIWPLDARLRSKGTTRNLVLMAMECGDAFAEAVDAILDVIVPYQLYAIEHSLRLEQGHSELLERYPRAFLRLTNALIDPALFPVPNDLGTLLQDCVAADPRVVTDPAYTRLHGLRRQRNA
jgi:NAD-dependent SIR2 family protein deacetylase